LLGKDGGLIEVVIREGLMENMKPSLRHKRQEKVFLGVAM
jgi:hypothetical protein